MCFGVGFFFGVCVLCGFFCLVFFFLILGDFRTKNGMMVIELLFSFQERWNVLSLLDSGWF